MRPRCSGLAEWRKSNSQRCPCARFPEDAQVALNGKTRQSTSRSFRTSHVCSSVRRMSRRTSLLTFSSHHHNAAEVTSPSQQALAPEHILRRTPFMSMSILLSGCCHHSSPFNRVDNSRLISHRTPPSYPTPSIQACRVPQDTTSSYLHVPDPLLTFDAGLPTQQPEGFRICWH